ncbi:MAG: hypothetical protein ABI995_05605, partial [Acidobacteriota bacterium]
MGMFENTLLTNKATTRKTAALATSFVAQILITGVVVVAPLLYTQALPMLPQLVVVLAAPKPPQAPPPPPDIQQQTLPTTKRAPGIFHAPTRVPTTPIPTSVIDEIFVPPTD